MKSFTEKYLDLMSDCYEHLKHICIKYGKHFDNFDTASLEAWKHTGWSFTIDGLELNNKRVYYVAYCSYLNGEKTVEVRIGNELHNIDCIPDEDARTIADHLDFILDL